MTISPNKDLFVIGIGASAGGLQALKLLFQNIPLDSAAYVVVQHMALESRQMLTDYLNHETVLKVIEAENNMVVEPNKVYVVPVNKQITIKKNTLFITNRKSDTAVLRTINGFFKSLAADKANKAIGVILSGTGTDGIEGIKAIKEAGGLILVQDPETAKFDGLPRNAIQTGMADYILPPELIPDEIFNFAKIAPITALVTEFLEDKNQETLNQILDLVHDRTGLDFVNYKKPTIIRRISRRMAVLNLHNLIDYQDYLQLHSEEIETISKEFLIGVTKFFRDREAFEVLQNKVIPSMVEDKKPLDPMRFWVAGCSTGEEAYSLAILVQEYLDAIKKQLEIKIFATDIDREALEFAGRAIYPSSSLLEVSEERLERFFLKDEGKYRVKPHIRKMVILSAHNIISDPPFSKMDLVSCRNMLIYLNPILQKKIMFKFHYALQQGGYLFLGSSESVGDMKNFVEVNKKWKIFRNIEQSRPLGLENFANLTTRKPFNQILPVSTREVTPKFNLNFTATEALSETILEELGYAAVYVDTNFDVLHATGDYTKFITLPNKVLTLNLLKMVPADLSLNLGSLLRKTVRDKDKVALNNILVRDKNTVRRLNLIIKPYFNDKRLSQNFILVLFNELAGESVAVEDPEKFWYENQNEGRITELEVELQHTKEDLQAVVEELETANEELQSTNEELLSSNEELQSTNEELQSLNEELHTINAEHQYKIRILSELDDDLNNYFRSTNISQIFLDRKLTIRKYTPAATRQINLIESDIGRSIYHISTNLKYDGIIEDIRKVIAQTTTIEKEVQDKDGIWYQMRIMPYITQEGKIDGAIVIFVDIHELKNLHLLRTGILDSSVNMIQAFDAIRNEADQIVDFKLTLVNKKAQEYLEGSEDEIIGKRFRQLFPGSIRNQLFSLLAVVANTGQTLDTEIEQVQDDKVLNFHLVAVKLNDGIVLTLEDITARKKAEQQLLDQAEEIRQSAERFQLLSEAIPLPTWTSLPDGFTNSYNQNWHHYTGLTLAQTEGWGWAQVIHPDYRENVVNTYRQAMQTGETFRVETLMRRHDGNYRWHLNYAVPLRNEDGEVSLWIGTATDIHEQKTLINELVENRHFIRQVAETSPDFIYVYDLKEQKNVFLNRQVALTLGYNPADITQNKEINFNSLLHPDDVNQVKAFREQFMHLVDHDIKEITYRMLDGQGQIRWFRDRATIFKTNNTGETLQIVGVAQDVTENIIAEQKLHSEKEFSEKLLNNSIDGIVAFDKNATITSWNVMMEVLNGIRKDEVLGKNIFDLFPEYHTNEEGKAIRRALQGEKVVLHDHPYGIREGSYETSTVPLFNDNGEVIGGLSIIHDITERLRMENERINVRLYQQKEILNAILETQESERKRISESLHNGLGQLLYATKLKLSDFNLENVQNKELKKAVEDLLDDAIKETRQISFELMPSILRDFGLEAGIAEICKRVSSSKISLHCEVIGLKERLNSILETSIFRIAQELLNNILKHSRASEASIQVVNQKSKIVLRVEDNGVGFEVQKLNTTGSGLSSIRNRLELVNGTLNIDSEPGQGSRFTIIIKKTKE